MPQFDPALFAPQIIWLLIAFGGLWFVLARLALPRVERAMVERAEQIEADLEAARGMRADAKALAEAQDALIADARTRAAAIAERTRTEIRARSDKRLGKLEAELEARIVEAEARIASATEAALAGIAPIAAEVSGEIVLALAGMSADAGRLKTAVERASGGDTA